MQVKLIERERMTDDTYMFKFAFPDPEKEFGLHLGGHFLISANIPTAECPEGEVIERKYTPTSALRKKGGFDVPIKIYRKNLHP